MQNIFYIEWLRKVSNISMSIRTPSRVFREKKGSSFRWNDSADNPPLVERFRRTMMDAR